MRDLQKKHKEWCEKNFGGREPKTDGGEVIRFMLLIEHLGDIARNILKKDQGIRPDRLMHPIKWKSKWARIIALAKNVETQFYKDEKPSKDRSSALWPLLGIQEELGELVGVHNNEHKIIHGLKEDQIDAVGDIVLYLLDYCNKAGIDFEDAVRQTAEKVHARDWNANSVNGEVE